MQKNRFTLFGVLIGFALLGASCGSAPVVIETQAEFSGLIREIQPNPIEGFQGWITVESPSSEGAATYKVTINDETNIFKLNSGRHEFMNFGTLEVNQQVVLWFTLLNLDAIPVEAVAEQVVILP
ncbi:MAG: hypothetical protein FVQ83_14835 [Chloroflexi bacterium]|nr:hypothetical protein [Chloroflexota bacterium]